MPPAIEHIPLDAARVGCRLLDACKPSALTRWWRRVRSPYARALSRLIPLTRGVTDKVVPKLGIEPSRGFPRQIYSLLPRPMRRFRLGTSAVSPPQIQGACQFPTSGDRTRSYYFPRQYP